MHLCIYRENLRERAHSHLAKLSLNIDFFKKPKYFKCSLTFHMFIGIYIQHTHLHIWHHPLCIMYNWHGMAGVWLNKYTINQTSIKLLLKGKACHSCISTLMH